MMDRKQELNLRDLATRDAAELQTLENALEGETAGRVPSLWTEDFAASGKQGKNVT